jgi:hypothetical protein
MLLWYAVNALCFPMAPARPPLLIEEGKIAAVFPYGAIPVSCRVEDVGAGGDAGPGGHACSPQ